MKKPKIYKVGKDGLRRSLTPPPAEWEGPYGKLAEQCGIEGPLSHAFETLKTYFLKLNADELRSFACTKFADRPHDLSSPHFARTLPVLLAGCGREP